METTNYSLPAKDFSPGNFNPLSAEVSKYVLLSIAPDVPYVPQVQTTTCNSKQGEDETKLMGDQRKEICSGSCGIKASFDVLSLPPKYTTVRVNLLKISLVTAQTLLEQYLEKQYRDTKLPQPQVYPHHQLPDLLVIKSSGLHTVVPESKEVVVGKRCGCAVLRGAEVFAPGVMGFAPDIQSGDRVAVFADLTELCLRGSKVYSGQKMFLGNGVACQTRRDLFTHQKCSGVAVKMKEHIFHNPTLCPSFQDRLFLQNLPSLVCGHVLKPEKHGVVLDMCAAPGGKTTHIATLMCNTGHVIAIDRSQNKIDQIKANAEKLSLTNIYAYKFDSSKLVSCNVENELIKTVQMSRSTMKNENETQNQEDKFQNITDDVRYLCNSSISECLETTVIESGMNNQHASHDIKNNINEFPRYFDMRVTEYTSNDHPSIHEILRPRSEMLWKIMEPPYPRSLFKWILLDAPCSALGQRPQLNTKMSIKELQSYPIVQRKLFQSAIALLEPGGRLVYSTCTITSEENEKMVKWVLDSFSDMDLVDVDMELGRPGLPHCGLNKEQCGKVRRFGPIFFQSSATPTSLTLDSNPALEDDDTIGFFIAVFIKRAHTQT